MLQRASYRSKRKTVAMTVFEHTLNICIIIADFSAWQILVFYIVFDIFLY